MHYFSNVMLIDIDTTNQIGECWVVEVEAQNKQEARQKIRTKAWEEVDSRINDARIELLDGPSKGNAAEKCGRAREIG